MTPNDDRDISRFTLLDVMILIAAFAVASFLVLPYRKERWPSPELIRTYVIFTVAGVVAMLSFFGIMLHHMLNGDRPHFGFCGGLALAFSSLLLFSLITGNLLLRLAIFFVPIAVGLLFVLFLTALVSLIVILPSRTLRSQLSWLDYYGLASVLLGTLPILVVLDQFGRM